MNKMDAERWQKAKEIFNAALKREPSERASYLDEICDGDTEIRSEVESLLASHDEANSFLENPPIDGEDLTETKQLQISNGATFGHYEIVSQIGVGGMGEVYLALDKKLDRKVAVKILNEKFAKHEANLQRFVKEAKAASALNHPNILTIYEIGDANETHYIVSEYIEGETLREVLNRQSLTLAEILDITVQVANALSTAHAAKIIHRDIKPENIVVRPDGLVKILDFGLAKLIEEKVINLEKSTIKQNQTAKGIILGTVNYMSPEQAKGEKVDERTDIFSLGVVIYEMIAGKTPFAGDSLSETFANLINKEPLPLMRFSADAPDELQRIISKTLRKNKDERYQTMKGLLADLKELKENLAFSEKLEKSRSSENENETKQFRATTQAGQAQIVTTDKNPTQTKNRRKIFFAAALVVSLAVFGVWYFSKRAANSKQIKSIAVLPFENSSGNADLEYLSDGVSESVIDRLSQLPQIKVIARSSSFQYRGQNPNLKQIADALGVDAVVTGRVAQREGSYLIRVDVTDVRENKQLWGENFTKKVADVQILQSDISREIAENLRVKLSGTQTELLTKQRTNNAQAYELLLKGRFYYNKTRRENFDKAVEYYEQAIAVDPNYALAYAELTEAYNNNGGRGLDLNQILVKQEAAAQRALELDPNLAEAHYAIGEIRRRQWNWEEARSEYLRTIELNPNLPRAYRGYAQYFSLMGWHDEAVATAKRSRDLDPLSPVIVGNYAYRLYSARRLDEALKVWQENAELTPESPVPHFWLGNVYAAKGMSREAIAQYQECLKRRDGDATLVEAVMGVIYAKTGERARAEEILERAKTPPGENTPPNLAVYYERNLALLYDALGKRDEAFAMLEKGFARRNPNLPLIAVDLAFDDMRSDPRFQNLVRRMNLPQ